MVRILKDPLKQERVRKGTVAFWAKAGEVIENDKSHIDVIVEDPEKFGLTYEEIAAVYEEHGETIGSEGEAREEVIKMVARNGWIRVRHYVTKGKDYWSVQVDQYRRRKRAIDDFLWWAISEDMMLVNDELVIIGYDDGTMLRYSFMEGGVKAYLEERSSTDNSIAHEDALYELRDEVVYGGDFVFRKIDEAGLSRLLSRMSENSVFALFTAYRDKFTKRQNIQRNRDMRGELDRYKLGAYPLVGHWQECQLIDDNGDPVEYDKCPREHLKDVVERSYLVVKPSGFDSQRFKEIMFELGAKYQQDSIVFVGNGKGGVYDPRTGEEYLRFKDKTPNVNQIAQAYSQYVRKVNVPFMFEGIETPVAAGAAKAGARAQGFRWIVASEKAPKTVG